MHCSFEPIWSLFYSTEYLVHGNMIPYIVKKNYSGKGKIDLSLSNLFDIFPARFKTTLIK